MDFETAFDLLGNEYRRAIVALLDEEGSVPRERLPSRLRSRDLLGDDPTRRRLRTALNLGKILDTDQSNFCKSSTFLSSPTRL